MTYVLIVEDNADILAIMAEILVAEGYRVATAPNGAEALEIFKRETPDLVISDIMMPRLDGFGLLEAVRAHPAGLGVPFLFLSARTEAAATSRARSLGADDYIFKPFAPDELLVAIKAKLERRRALQFFDTRNAHLQTVQMLANVIEARESYTRGHVERVQRYALDLARALGWGTEALAVCEYGALLHDIGKIAVSRAILNKRERLVYSEWALLRRHPETGARMLENIHHLGAARPYVVCHHERWDGSGYPARLAGAAIPREGRLLAVVDVYDAMTTDRPYRRALPSEQALAEIRRQSGRHFDPEMAEIFIQLRERELVSRD
ncbi:MAG: response regulator [Anaerolineales bacterium]|nr:response regulator [Anaerolineales bacterium]